MKQKNIRRCILIAGSAIIFNTGLISCLNNTPRFELVGSDFSGIDFNNVVMDEDSFNILHYEYMYNGGGVGVGDLNNDGLQDLIFSGNKTMSRIYLNQGDFKFLDITQTFKGFDDSQWLSGVCVVDINADGLNDVYFTSTMSADSLKRRNQLWINQGLGKDGLPTFAEQAAIYGIADTGYSMNATFFDYDLDGDLDLYVLNNVITKEVPTNYHTKIIDGTSANNDHLYENLGSNRFVDVTRKAGITFEGYGLGLAISDINKDGYPDVYVSNDYVSNDLLYINQRDGTFRNHSKKYLSYQSRFSMGNDISDINNDGNLDIITMDMMPEQYFRKKQTINGNSYYVYVNNEKYGYEPQFVRNMLQVHNGFQDTTMLPFSEVGQFAGVYQTEWSWSPLFADFDNDGDKDLFVTNGFPKDLTDKDFTNYKAQVYGSLASDAHMLQRIPVVKVSNYAYENIGDLRFEDQTKKWGMNIPSFSNGAAFVDLDNDGDLDYVVNNINDPAFVYRNNTFSKNAKSANHIQFKLVGVSPNLDAIGSKVQIWSGGNYQYQEKFVTRGYISSVDPIMHFGLGNLVLIDSIRITWPTGKKTTILKNIKGNQKLTLNEEDSKPLKERMVSTSNSQFTQVEDLISYSHQEKDYIDFFQGQSIIPHKFSQIGPCMAAGDFNNDGEKDILIGAAADQPTLAFLKKNGQFIQSEIAGLTGPKVGQESDLQIVDIDGDGDNDVLAVTGGYILEDETQYLHYLYRNEAGIFSKEQLSLPPFPASVARLFDFDKDGDLDLFIGCRVKKRGFPTALRSYILINEKGNFLQKDEFSFDLGMTTDAVWSDYDGDGWSDLLISREWNSIAILKNQAGKIFTQVVDDKLEAKHGLWSSLAVGDFDNDGDDDYIAGNLGLNNRFTISDKFPMRVYSIDLDKNGYIDPVSTAYWRDKQGKMQEYPINYLDELASQSPFFRKTFTNYTDFSYSTANQIMGADSVGNQSIYFVNTTASYVIWNNQGAFTLQELPMPAQLAPIKKMVVYDFNNDQIMDVLLGGNDHSYDVSTGYYDANKGTILLGSADKTFSVLPPSKSGLLLNGQVSSLLLLEGDTSFIIGGINRKPIQVFEFKKSN